MTLKFILPKISHMVAVYFLFVYFHQSYGHPSPIPSNRSMDYKWELLSEFSLALIGIILNSIGMNLLLTLDSEGRDSMTFYSLNVALSAVDMTCLLTRVASIISVLYYHGYYGGNSGITCSLSAMFIAICAFWSISIVVGISYVAKHNLYIEKKLTQKDMCIWVAVSGTVATAITFAGAYVPDGGFGMDSSGTFCFLKLYSYTSATIYFGVGLTIIYGVLARNLILIYQAVQKSQQILKQHSINSYAKSSYIKMLVKLSYFYIGMHISFIPVLINFIYEISQQDYIDPQYSTFCALFSTLNPSLVNPILLFLLNYRIRYQFKQKYSYIYDTFIKIKRFIIMGSNRSRVGSVLLNSPVKYCYQMENWMTDPTLWSFFVEYGKKHYVVENLLFYDDVRRYRALGDEILQLIQNRLGDCVASKWTDLERHAIRIYTVYIEVLTAPLEINIDCGTRTELCDNLFSRDNLRIQFPTMNDDLMKDLNEIQKYISIFEKSQIVIYETIVRDIWPRFRKSSEYFHYLQSVKAANSIKAIVTGKAKPLIFSKKIVQVGSVTESSKV